VQLLCGSESGFALTPYGHWHAREMEVFVDALGISALEAITCATRNNALAVRLDGRIGVVAEGYLADVLVVDGDPAADIRILQDRSRLRAVISRGRSVDLSAPWPERARVPGEKVGNWAAEVLTYDRALGDS
jgi:imidazolonepropionase-like amidohydrolase